MAKLFRVATNQTTTQVTTVVIAAVIGLIIARPTPAQIPKLRKTIHPAKSPKVKWMDFSPDGKTIALACEDKTVKLWDVATKKVRSVFRGHKKRVQKIAFSRDGKLVGSIDDNESVLVWDARTHQVKAEFPGCRFVSFGSIGTTVATVERNRYRITLRDSQTGQFKRQLKVFARKIVISPNHKFLAAADSDNIIKLVDVNTGKVTQTLKGHTKEIYALAISPDNRVLASGDSNKTIRLWDVATGKVIFTFSHDNAAWTLAFSPDSEKIAVTDTRGVVVVFNLQSKKVVNRFYGQKYDHVCFSPDSKMLATLGRDYTLNVWDLATGRNKSWLPGHTNAITSLAFSPDGKVLASGSLDYTVRLWDARTGELTSVYQDCASAWNLAFGPNGKVLGAGGGIPIIRSPRHHAILWDVTTGKATTIPKPDNSGSQPIALHPDGKTLAIGEATHGIVGGRFRSGLQLWDIRERKPKGRFKWAGWPAECLAFSPDGKTLAVGIGLYSDMVMLWDVATAKKRATLEGGAVRSLAFSPDGQTLAVGGGVSVRTYDLETGKITSSAVFHDDAIVAVALHPKVKIIAVATSKNVFLWNPATRKTTAILKDQSHGPLCVAFSPDGQTLATGGADKNIKLWDIAEKKD